MTDYTCRNHRRRYECRLDLPPIDNRRGIQDLLNEIVAALCADTIDYRRAAAMLTALRMARETLIKSGSSKGTAFRPSVSAAKSTRL